MAIGSIRGSLLVSGKREQPSLTESIASTERHGPLRGPGPRAPSAPPPLRYSIDARPGAGLFVKSEHDRISSARAKLRRAAPSRGSLRGSGAIAPPPLRVRGPGQPGEQAARPRADARSRDLHLALVA